MATMVSSTPAIAATIMAIAQCVVCGRRGRARPEGPLWVCPLNDLMIDQANGRIPGQMPAFGFATAYELKEVVSNYAIKQGFGRIPAAVDMRWRFSPGV